ncbi:alpha/beta-hydrolase [Aureobasidium pullulans]|uniref:Alpha/beta-hydrolase n=1 Tax=Aureobasidium pullulans TaxID=5580 RepID=A0A4S9U3J9_AURPU|nr:alpha/beta-hydrolase [Aureobasidium pullulans]
MPSTFLLASFLCLFRALLVTSTQDYKGPLDVNEEVPCIRNYFYAGGRYVSDGSGGHVFQDQMYVERLTPPGGPRKQTPLNFLNKPDGGRGWASLFIMQGFEVYIVDQTSRGRSAWRPGDGAPGLATSSVEIIQQRFTAPQDYKLWSQAANHTQWPGTGRMGDPIFDAFYSSNVQYVNNDTYQQATMQASGADLLDRIGSPVILIGHSQAGPQAILIADARPNLTEAIILLEPGGPPFRGGVFSNASARPWGLADVPLLYSPPVTDPVIDLTTQIMPATSDNLEGCVLQATSPPPKRLSNLAPKPILVVTAEASYHSVYDHCTVSYLRQAGCTRTDHLELGNAGVHGNGHMLFMEKNSREVWVLLLEWIEWHLN